MRVSMICSIDVFFFVCFSGYYFDNPCNLFQLPKSYIFLTRFKTLISHKYFFYVDKKLTQPKHSVKYLSSAMLVPGEDTSLVTLSSSLTG